MEAKNSSKKYLSIALSFLIGAIIFLGFVININSNLKTRLNTEKLRQDSILSTKLLLDKEILELSAKMYQVEGRNKKLDSVLVQTLLKLDEKSKLIEKLSRENATVKKLKKELLQFKEMYKNLNKQMDELIADYKKQTTENRKLKNQIETLEQQLSEANARQTVSSSGFVAQNFRIEFQKKNPDKLTVKGKKTKNIKIEFNLNSSESKNSEETLYIKIIDPAGFIVTPNITPVVIKNEKIIYSSLEKVQLSGTTKKIIINVKPETKMKQKGIYKIIVYNPADGLIGSAEIRTN